MAALRYLDRNPVRAGLVDDPTTYPWSSCAAYARGTPNQVITFHPSYLALSPYGKVRRRHYATLLVPSEGIPGRTPAIPAGAPSAPWAAQPSWRPTSPGGDAEELESCPRRITRLGPKWCPVPFLSEIPASTAKRAWARLIKQVYEADPLVCPRCGGAMRILEFIEQPEVIEKILTLLAL